MSHSFELMTTDSLIFLICYGLVCAAMGALAGALRNNTTNERYIMKTQEEILLELQTANTRIDAQSVKITGLTGIVTKTHAETKGLKADIQALKDIIANQGGASPEVEALVAAMGEKLTAQEVETEKLLAALLAQDAEVEDAPAPEPTPTPETPAV